MSASQDKPQTGVQPLGNVTVMLVPASREVPLGDTFAVDVVIVAGTNQVTAVDVHLAFDRAHLRATSAPTAVSPFGAVDSRYDNAAGTLDFGGLIIRSYATGTFTLCTLHLRAVALTNGTPAQIAPRSFDDLLGGILVVDPGGNEHAVTWGGNGAVSVVAQPGTATPTATRTATPTSLPTLATTVTPTMTPEATVAPPATPTHTPRPSVDRLWLAEIRAE